MEHANVYPNGEFYMTSPANPFIESHTGHCDFGEHLCEKAFELIKIVINEKEYLLPEGIYRVSDLKKLANVPDNHRLVRILAGNLIFLKNEECVGVDGHEHFETSAGCGKAS